MFVLFLEKSKHMIVAELNETFVSVIQNGTDYYSNEPVLLLLIDWNVFLYEIFFVGRQKQSQQASQLPFFAAISRWAHVECVFLSILLLLMTCYDSVNGLYKHFNLLPIQGAEAAAAAMVVKNPSILLISCIHGTIGANAHLPQDLVCVFFFQIQSVLLLWIMCHITACFLDTRERRLAKTAGAALITGEQEGQLRLGFVENVFLCGVSFFFHNTMVVFKQYSTRGLQLASDSTMGMIRSLC